MKQENACRYRCKCLTQPCRGCKHSVLGVLCDLVRVGESAEFAERTIHNCEPCEMYERKI